MSLIKSISGIRGTIGGKPDENLSPIDVVKFSAAFGTWLLQQNTTNKKVIIGRDGRISGAMVQELAAATLIALGIDVIDAGLSTTPTIEMAIQFEKAAGGMIISASHNPKEWNALKLFNHLGEFISAEDGKQVLSIAEKNEFNFASVDKLGNKTFDDTFIQKHIQAIVAYDLVDVQAIKKRKFKIVIDAINSTGAIAVPALLQALGVKDSDIVVLNSEVTGKFAHNPEPLPEHLQELCNAVNKHKADIGIAVDPDVDRLSFVCEDGSLFGEEYTLVAVADYVLNNRKGNTVSNMSSTRALKDVTLKHGGNYYPSAVGEVNVVNKMKAVNAVIGGEGNGGVIVPDLHYGRDALIGIALFLTFLAKEKKSVKQLRNTYPDYFISKNKIELGKDFNIQQIFDQITKKYKKYPINTEDGLKIEFENDWVHLRTSNTEPIIRIYAESNFSTTADNIAKKMMQDIREVM
ncbi:phosphoglucosamine mutase [Hydrotalea sandarakina]|jgi:phosphomannomutase|uniref:Phosphomannomutase n=1 Tax=Hydrotalea sandarakina TaxID=1004304 RepID=A0A2W7S9A4_9BACT|nr:phosphoglucosamine mutase [Hydrotalea sandarakina]PZX63569.1 phosphomannomutase [Hydrotalea sandarakina]